MMKRGMWRVALTVELDGVLVDWMELSSATRTLILLELRRGVTSGEVFEDETWEKAAS